jgi:hypothetical protein
MSLINTLTNNQINSSFVFSCIKNVQDQINANDITYTDDTNNLYISSESSTQYDPGSEFILSVGTNNDISANNSTCLLVGSGSATNYCDSTTVIGHGSGIFGTNTYQTSNVINIGHESNVNNPADGEIMDSIILLGNNNDIDNGSNIVVIGNDLNHGSQLNNNVIISASPLDTLNGRVPTDGSIILQSSSSSIANKGGQPSSQPRFCILGDELLNPRGQNAGDVLDGLTIFNIPQINGYIRMKYKGVPVLIPVLLDTEGDANVGNPTNINEFP